MKVGDMSDDHDDMMQWFRETMSHQWYNWF